MCLLKHNYSRRSLPGSSLCLDSNILFASFAFFAVHLSIFCFFPVNVSQLSLLISFFFAFFLSLLPVLPWCLRHFRPVRQTLGPHIDVFLQRPAHLPHHAQLSHRGREPVHPAAPAIHPRRTPVPPRPLRLEQVCLPLRHRSG